MSMSNPGSFLPKISNKWTWILVAAGAAFVLYKMGAAKERKRIAAQAAAGRPTGTPTLQQQAQMQQAWLQGQGGAGMAGMRDQMGFQNLGDLSCGNKPCSKCAQQGCQQPAVHQAEIPSEEFEFMS